MRLLVIGFLFFSVCCQAETISLDMANDRMVNKNHSIKLANLKRKQSEVMLKQAWGSVFPNIDLVFDHIHNELIGTRRLSSATALTNAEQDNLNLAPINANRIKLSVNQVLYDSKIPDQIDLATRQYEMAELEYDQTIQDFRLELATLYYEIGRLEKNHKLALLEVETLTENLEEIKNKRALNLHTKQDVLDVQMQLAESKQNELNQRQSLRLNRHRFNHMIGQDIRDEFTIDIGVLNPVYYLDISDSLGALETAWENRKDYLLLLNQKNQRLIEKKMLDENIIPVVSFQSTVGTTHSSEFSFYREDKDISWTIAATVPIFTGFKQTNKIEEINIMIDIIETEIALKKEAIRIEINDAIYEMNLAKQRSKDQDIAIELAKERLDIISAKYAEKSATQIDLMKAKNNLTKAKLNQVTAQYELAIAAAKFKHSIGRNPIQI
ncbi:MAG: TolC family protein [Candidatus Marinamargulisbacteria bacterium]